MRRIAAFMLIALLCSCGGADDDGPGDKGDPNARWDSATWDRFNWQ